MSGSVSRARNGTLRESWRQQPGGPVYCNDLPADQLREHLASLGTERTAAQHAEFLAQHAKQEREIIKRLQ